MSHAGVPTSLTRFSGAISRIVARAAPCLVAVRVGGSQHIAGVLWRPDLIVTSDRALPPQDIYTVMLANGSLASARSGQRDPIGNVALLHLDVFVEAEALLPGAIAVGGLAFVFGTEADASPSVRMALIHRLVRNPSSDGHMIVLDMVAAPDAGGPVFDAHGGLIGIAGTGPAHEAVVIPFATIARLADGFPMTRQPDPDPDPVRSGREAQVNAGRRGWLGVALQPITVPEPLVPRAGQASGRMVMSLTPGGPADRGGLRVGDVLLALDGHSASGPNALRAFMGPDRIGSQIEVKLLRDGAVMMANLTVAGQPGH